MPSRSATAVWGAVLAAVGRRHLKLGQAPEALPGNPQTPLSPEYSPVLRALRNLWCSLKYPECWAVSPRVARRLDTLGSLVDLVVESLGWKLRAGFTWRLQSLVTGSVLPLLPIGPS
jgi:hypothetical protein